MSTDDLRADIVAVEQEITGRSVLALKKHRRDIPWVTIISALLLFIVIDEYIESEAGSGLETDLNHMMQQARHELLEYKFENGRLPENVSNPSLKPYVILKTVGYDRFVLVGQLGSIKQELELKEL